jgi:hypothetical protein
MPDKTIQTPDIWVRPDGRDAAVYVSLVSEGRDRMAWEFLIRNADFQQDCRAVNAGFLQGSDVAAAWGLYKFKSFEEAYASDRKPRFADSKVSFFRAKSNNFVRHIGLLKGQMAFVLDVDRMVESEDSRGAQMTTLIRYVDAAIARRRKRRNIQAVPVSRARDAHLAECLRIADLLHLSISPKAIKSDVKYLKDGVSGSSRPNEKGERGARDAGTCHTRFRDMKGRIDVLINQGGYLKLARRAHSA